MAEEFHPEIAASQEPPKRNGTVSLRKPMRSDVFEKPTPIAENVMPLEQLHEALRSLKRERSVYDPKNDYENFNNKLAELDAKIADEKDPARLEQLKRARDAAANLTTEQKVSLFDAYGKEMRELTEANPEPQKTSQELGVEENRNHAVLNERIKNLGIHNADHIMDNGDLVQVLLFAQKPEELLPTTRELMKRTSEEILDPNTPDAVADRKADQYLAMKKIEELASNSIAEKISAAERITSSLSLKELQDAVRQLQFAEGSTAEVSPEVRAHVADLAGRFDIPEQPLIKRDATKIMEKETYENLPPAERALRLKIDEFTEKERELAQMESDRVKNLMSQVSPVSVEKLVRTDVPSLLVSQSDSPEELNELALARLKFLDNLTEPTDESVALEKSALHDILGAVDDALSAKTPDDEREKLRDNFQQLSTLMRDYRVQQIPKNYEYQIGKVIAGDTATAQKEAETNLQNLQDERFQKLMFSDVSTAPDLELTEDIQPDATTEKTVSAKIQPNEDVFRAPAA